MSPCCRTIRPWHRFINCWSEIWLVALSVQRRSSTDSSSRGCFGLLLVKMSKSHQNQQQIVCLASSDHSRETHTMFVNELQPTGDGNSIKNNVQKKHLNTKRNSRFYITHTHTHTHPHAHPNLGLGCFLHVILLKKLSNPPDHAYAKVKNCTLQCRVKFSRQG